ncbi:MAG: EAL domain-containing protein [Bdellovibrionaceae bacterium]|nr:EAL domain-containing protein [Pseudobdellovibrionaceae bacterium]NUM58757.1 EAL domain-containing protein [Pseudobdellovibrionaceae bacterium]
MSKASVVPIPANQLIFSQGELGDKAYIIEKGRVLIYLTKDNEDFPLSILGEGEIFGEMAIIDNQVRSASAKTLDDCSLLVVTKDQLLERVQSADTVVRLLLRVLLKRLRSQNDLIVVQPKKKIFNTQKAHQEDKQAVEKIKLEARIANAFDNKEFVMFYQPILDLKTEKIVAAEALIRWFPPTGEQISPAVFMDVVENSSMIIPFGKWIVEKCFSDLKKIQLSHALCHDFSISINISGKQFTHIDFINDVESLRKRLALEAPSIKLEMTERVMMDGNVALDTLLRFDQLGYKLSIDDFGTGFSSLQYLFRMPLDNIKIDRSFVRDMMKDDKALAIVKSLIYLAQSLRMKVIAEGIEKEEEKHLLKALGVDFAQGFLFSKAIPLEELLKKLIPSS